MLDGPAQVGPSLHQQYAKHIAPLAVDHAPPSVDLLADLRPGQRLAAANCAYIGARGLFRERGAGHARAILASKRIRLRQHAY